MDELIAKRIAACFFVVFALVAGPLAGLNTPANAAGRAPQSFYIDADNGNNANPGTQAQPWKDLSKVNYNWVAFIPGDQILLKRGSVFRTTSIALADSGTASQPIRIGSYGDGPAPTIDLSSLIATPWVGQQWGGVCAVLVGNYITWDGVNVRNCQAAGIQVDGDHVVVKNSEVSGNASGIMVDSGADYATIDSNNVRDNNRMMISTPCSYNCYDDYGASGIVMSGDNGVVQNNDISGSAGPSPDYGVEGSAIEIFASDNTLVTGNRASNNIVFSELGASGYGTPSVNPAKNNTFSNNTVTSGMANAIFVAINGPLEAFGAVVGTVVRGNNVYLTGPNTKGFQCHGGCRQPGDPERLTLTDNMIWSLHGVTGDCSGWQNGSCTSRNNVYPPSTGNPNGAGGCWGPRDGVNRSGDSCPKSSSVLADILSRFGVTGGAAAEALKSLGTLVTPGGTTQSDDGSWMCQGLPATIIGTVGRDTLVGTAGNDVIVGLGGKDRIYGGGGDDTICAGDGRDFVRGAAGNDTIFGEAGKDKLSGGRGRNHVFK